MSGGVILMAGQRADDETRPGQFIAVFGRRNSALFLDCETLAYQHFPLNLDKAGLGILVYDTRVRRKLASSAYNTRRDEASRALEILKANGASSYKEANLVRLERVRPAMSDVLYRRARHVISENARVRLSVKALQADDFAALGGLLFQSHESLRDDYEVSCPELDLLYETGRGFLGCLGARLVGAGFGGSGIALVEKALAGIPEAEKPSVLLAMTISRGAKIAVEVPAIPWMQTVQVRLAGLGSYD